MHQQLERVEFGTEDGRVVCQSSRGAELHGKLIRARRHSVVLELHSASDVLQTSEVLSSIEVRIDGKVRYTGRATVASLIDADPSIICEVRFDKPWIESGVQRSLGGPADVRESIHDLVRGWQRLYRIAPAFKTAVADIQSFLFNLRQWADQMELASGENENAKLGECEAVRACLEPVTDCLDRLFQRFEQVALDIPDESRATHAHYAQRQLHSSLLSSPFMHRIYRKPLGYAGDYEMVNMILRDPCEGSSLFAKLLNSWFLSQLPAEAHRNRVAMLANRLAQESCSVTTERNRLRVFNLGCGPAEEVRRFIHDCPGAPRTEFSLLDFNDETLEYARNSIQSGASRKQMPRLDFVKRSVGQIIRAGGRQALGDWDVVYCAGLFDYLENHVCRQLTSLFYRMLRPGGLLMVTNVDPSNPIKQIMGLIFEWHLIYRNPDQLMAVAPVGVPPDCCRLVSDETGCNIFLEVRKPLERV